MAKENYISLKGQLRGDVRFVMDPDTGEITSAMFPLYVLRRNIWDRAGNLSPKFDRPIILTSDKEIIRAVKELKKYDIVEVKGSFRTKMSSRHKVCEACGETTTVDAPIQLINPSFVGAVVTNIQNNTEGLNYLLNVAEISNIAKVIGRVCCPTDSITMAETENGVPYCRYQLAVNRKLYVADSDGEEDHADYPVVISYGDIAYDDHDVLQQNALVYLDGYIHVIQQERTTICPHCGATIPYKTASMTLSPYSMEYLRDFKDDVLESTHMVDEPREDEPLHDSDKE